MAEDLKTDHEADEFELGDERDPDLPLDGPGAQPRREGERVKLATELLEQILVHMGYALEVQCEERDGRIELTVTGNDAGELVGRKGQTLDALQFLLHRILNRRTVERTPVVVDCGGYRERRRMALVELAERLSEKATRSGKTVAVNPMSAHDRRIIHMALRENPSVTTRSEGEGEERRLLIVPVQE